MRASPAGRKRVAMAELRSGSKCPFSEAFILAGGSREIDGAWIGVGVERVVAGASGVGEKWNRR